MSTLATIPEKLKTRFEAARGITRERIITLTEQGKSALSRSKLAGLWERTSLRVRGALDLPSREALSALQSRVEKLARRIEAFEKKAEARVKRKKAAS